MSGGGPRSAGQFGSGSELPTVPGGHWLLGHLPALRADPLGFLESVPRCHGDLVPLRFAGYPALLLSHPRYVEHVLIHDSDSFEKPPRFRRTVRPVFGSGLFANEGSDWLRRRRHVQAALDEVCWDAYLECVRDEAQRVMASWPDEGVADAEERMFELVLRVRTRTTLGTQVPAAAEVVRETIRCFMADFAHRMRHPFSGPSWLPTARNRRLRRALAAWWRMIEEAMARDRHGPAPDQALLAQLQRRLEAAGGDRLKRGELRDELATWILTGIDTVANTLSWAMYLLAADKPMRTTLFHELRQTSRAEFSRGAELQCTSGLDGVLREAMRLYPQAYIIGRKAVRAFELDGHGFGAGTTVVLNQWSISRDARWFDDPERFAPARWRQGLASRLPRGAFFPFGAGPRICAGRGAAMRELPLILGLLLRGFDIERADNRPVLPRPSLTLPPAGPIPCHFRRRAGTG